MPERGKIRVDVRGLIDNVLSVDRLNSKQDRDPLDWRGDRSRLDSFGSRADRIPDIKVSVTVPINNQNQQEQTVDNTKNNPHFTNNLQGSNIGNLANQVNDTAQQKAIQHNYAPAQQSLAEAAQEIQDLIEQLAKTYPTDTRAAKNGFADEIVKQIDTNPAITNRLLSATKAGGVAAIEQFLNHPAVSFIVAAIEDWEKTKNTNVDKKSTRIQES